MTYLERNERILKEISQNLHLGKRSETGRSDLMVFIGVGSLYSSTLERPLFVGVKQYLNKDDEWFYPERLVRELAIIATIAEFDADLRAQVPAFLGLLKRHGQPAGLVTEDFSDGGVFPVPSYYFTPRDILSVFPKSSVDSDFLDHVAVKVNGRRRLMDLYPFFETSLNRSPVYELERIIKARINHHSIEVNYV